MFNLQLDDSLNEFLKEYEPDVAIIQECRPNKIIDVYKNPIMPNKFGKEKEIDARYVITVAFCKDNIWNRIDSEKLGKYNRCYVAIETTQNVNKAFSVLGIHIPAETNKNKEDLENFISEIKKSEFDIICGDFNASFRKP